MLHLNIQIYVYCVVPFVADDTQTQTHTHTQVPILQKTADLPSIKRAELYMFAAFLCFVVVGFFFLYFFFADVLLCVCVLNSFSFVKERYEVNKLYYIIDMIVRHYVYEKRGICGLGISSILCAVRSSQMIPKYDWGFLAILTMFLIFFGGKSKTNGTWFH